MSSNGKNTPSIELKRKIMKSTMYVALSLIALCAAFLIAACVRPDMEIFMLLFKYSGMVCLIACALFTIVVSSWPDSLPQQVYVNFAIPLVCHTADSFKEVFVGSIEEKGFGLIRKTLLESGDLFLCFIRDGSATQYIVLSLFSEFGEAQLNFSNNYIKEFLSAAYGSERVFHTHIICTGKYSPALKSYCERNTIAPIMDQFRLTAAVSLEDTMLYISRPKDCQGCYTLKTLEKKLRLYMQPLIE